MLSVRYGGKSLDMPASDYHYAFTTAYGTEKRICWNEGIAEAWVNAGLRPEPAITATAFSPSARWRCKGNRVRGVSLNRTLLEL
ncbi:MAG: coenzyme hydrogenase subunit beta [Candidatus Methanomethylophilaceae archaeon]|nr:coenzyme hydrogenase subunit beta [Candidatus Methanomethylophilaceae archaeon]